MPPPPIPLHPTLLPRTNLRPVSEFVCFRKKRRVPSAAKQLNASSFALFTSQMARISKSHLDTCCPVWLWWVENRTWRFQSGIQRVVPSSLRSNYRFAAIDTHFCGSGQTSAVISDVRWEQNEIFIPCQLPSSFSPMLQSFIAGKNWVNGWNGKRSEVWMLLRIKSAWQKTFCFVLFFFFIYIFCLFLLCNKAPNFSPPKVEAVCFSVNRLWRVKKWLRMENRSKKPRIKFLCWATVLWVKHV